VAFQNVIHEGVIILKRVPAQSGWNFESFPNGRWFDAASNGRHGYLSASLALLASARCGVLRLVR
jgi:hypothetical protein